MFTDDTAVAHEEPALSTESSLGLARDILGLVMQYRRMPLDSTACLHSQCAACVSQHIDRVINSIDCNEPIIFVLPAFPGKSPNPAKVLGARADMAERQSLAFLNLLSRRIRKIYAPGAKIVLCSDGRVFNDVVGILDNDITAYQQDIDDLIVELGAADSLTTFNLDHVFGGCSFDEMRSQLMARYGESLENVRAEVRANADARRMYCGITRFLLEDALRPEMRVSKTALQKDCRRCAYEVIQRSRSWDKLLTKHFPSAVRLSIHPQGCGSRKMGIHLIETEDEWLTAWHSVAVEVHGRFRLMKRAQAEKLGARMVSRDGRPSHYVLSEPPQRKP